jgi:hypothetical protein
MENKADLYQAVFASKVGLPPLVIRAVITDNNNYIVGGMPQSQARVENYILLSALPTELQDRVKTSIQTLIAGM